MLRFVVASHADQLYGAEVRAQLKAEGVQSKDVMSRVAAMWKELPEAEKKVRAYETSGCRHAFNRRCKT